MAFTDVAARHVSFTNKSIGNSLRYQWDFGDGNISSLTEPDHTYTRPGNYRICLTVLSGVDSCRSTYCADFIMADSADLVCRADFNYIVKADSLKVLFADNSPQAMQNWSWDFGDGTTSNLANPLHRYSREGVYTVCLAATTNAGCMARQCRPLLVATPAGVTVLTADFAYFITNGSQEVVFTDNSSGSATEWYWTFGDGSFGAGSEIVHQYARPGRYAVCLSVFDGLSGKIDRKCQEVMVAGASCTLSADFSLFTDHASRKVTFADLSNGAVDSWFWSFGDGKTATVSNPVHEYEAPGYYLVRLAVRNVNTACLATDVAYIKVGETDCKAGFAYMADMANMALKFTDESYGDVESWFWTFGNGNYSTEPNPEAVFRRPGWYQVGLTVTGAGGTCSDFYTESVYLGAVDCKADFDAYVDSSALRAYFQPQVMGDATYYFWNFGDGRVSVESAPEHVYPSAGAYTTTLTVFDPLADCADVSEKQMIVGSLADDCEADFYYTIDEATHAVRFVNRSLGEGLTYIWDFGDGDQSALINPEHIYFDPGYYNVCLNISSTSGYYNVVCRQIEVAVSETTACKADFAFVVDSATRTAKFYDRSYGEISSWKWSFGDAGLADGATQEHTYTANNYYTVRLEVSNPQNGCYSLAYKMVNVNMRDGNIQAGFGYEVDSLLRKGRGRPVDFVGVANMKSAKFEWDFGDGQTNSTTDRPTNFYAETGDYTVCLTVEDPVASQSDVYCQEIFVEVPATGFSETYAEPFRLAVLPNPFGDQMIVKYQLTKAAFVRVVLLDLTGRAIYDIEQASRGAGDYTIHYNTHDLKPGAYMLRYSSDAGAAVQW